MYNYYYRVYTLSRRISGQKDSCKHSRGTAIISREKNKKNDEPYILTMKAGQVNEFFNSVKLI